MAFLTLSNFLKRRSVRYGLPFLLVIVGGSFGLKEFAQLRYTFSKKVTVRDTIKKAGIEMKNPADITLEKEYDSLKELNIDNWEQVRGPRPWEEVDSQ